MSVAIALMERGLLPDALLRVGVRAVVRSRITEEESCSWEEQGRRRIDFVEEMKRSEIAPLPDKANLQHYEVPAALFELFLGENLKYSSCYFEDPAMSLSQAERCMLELSCKRAELSDGQRVLELGCGWGSLSLFMASRYPSSRFVAVSNSASQKLYIDTKAQARGLSNLKVITADMNTFEIGEKFERVVSIEMFEHMRNYERLLSKIANWLQHNGKLFVHIFCHRQFVYPYTTDGSGNWMGRYFFTGGMMPCEDIFAFFQRDLLLEKQWRVGGEHYSRTSRLWLENLDRNRDKALPVIEKIYGARDAGVWFQRWRVFLMACEELFGFRGGKEWFVSHYLLAKRASGERI
ncbi:MAG: SAM-dependent methyltransferase [Proteobacteria bacterium]|nr:MAG: SAM-dependent methyltransferase [Pseudomonadota bacterium]